MAFDVYVGTFTRYYRREWENVVQQQAKREGTQYRMVYAGGEPEPPPPADDIRAGINAWRDAINQALGENITNPLSWDESDDRPYFTDRPAWPGYNALLLWASYADHPQMTRPQKLPEEWFDDPAFLATTEAERLGPFGNIVRSNLWIPGDFKFNFGFVAPTNEKATIGSTSGFLESMNALNEATFKATSEDLHRWRMGEDSDSDDLESVARFGFAVFHALALKAVKHQLPILLSF